MRAVVTGGAGFVGSHLIEALVARGDEVLCLERPGARRGWLGGLAVDYRECGLDPAGLAGALDGADVVFHLAALTEARRPADHYRVNTEGTAHVLRAAARYNGRAPRVILMSSLAALGPNRGRAPLSPDSVPYPISHYGNSKLLAEAVMHAYADRVPGVILRFPSIYGPRERGVLILFKLVSRGVALTVGDWNREVSLMYVADVVNALIAAGTSDHAVGRTYCLGYPQPVTWGDFAAAVGRVLGRAPALVSIPELVARAVAVGAELVGALRHRAAILNRERLREMVQPRWVCDPSLAIAELGVEPQYGPERGVPETAAWYRGAGWL